MLYTVTVGAAKAQNFELAVFVFTPGDGSDLCCANVETYDNGLFVVHNCIFCLCLVMVMNGYFFWVVLVLASVHLHAPAPHYHHAGSNAGSCCYPRYSC